MLYGYTVCQLDTDSYTLTTRFQEGNAFFEAFRAESILRRRTPKNGDTFTYAYVPHLLYVEATSIQHIQRLQHGLILDELAPKKRLLCVLETLENGKFAPYTYKSNVRYTKPFVKPILYEALDEQQLHTEGWYYAAPIREGHTLTALPDITEQLTGYRPHELHRLTLFEQLLAQPMTMCDKALTNVALDLRAYTQQTSLICDSFLQREAGEAGSYTLQQNAMANALIVSSDLLQRCVNDATSIITVTSLADIQQQLEEAIIYETGPLANCVVIIGDATQLQAWLQPQFIAPLQVAQPLMIGWHSEQSFVAPKQAVTPYIKTSEQGVYYGFVDPLAYTKTPLVTRGHVMTKQQQLRFIDTPTGQPMLQPFEVEKAVIPLASNVVLFHPQDFLPYRKEVVLYEDDAVLPLFVKQGPLRQSVHYDTLQQFAEQPLLPAQIAPAHTMPTTPFYQMLATHHIHLNAQQQQAVETIDGPVMILAGAGTGKTTTLISRIAYMIEEKGIAPHEILLVTFTKKAASDMKERLMHLPNGALYSQVTVGTYHAICLRILREQQRTFTLLASDAAKHFRFKMILKQLGLTESHTPEGVMGIISNWKNRMLRPIDIKKEVEAKQDATEQKELRALYDVYNLYEREKESRNELDFDDFLLEVYYLLLYDEEARAHYQHRFRYVLCDEFQDVSLVQYELTKLLAAPHDHLCIVGDDNQTIYTWRAASSDFMLQFTTLYPNAKQVKLETNYRSTADIVGFSNDLIAHNKHQIKKTLNVPTAYRHAIYVEVCATPEEEAQLVLQEIQQLRASGMRYQQICVLTRSTTYVRTLFEHFVLHHVPVIDYAKQGENFYAHDYIKRFIAAMRVSLQPNDADALLLIGKLMYMPQERWAATITHEQLRTSDTSLLERVMLQMATEKRERYQQEAIKKQLHMLLRYRTMKPQDVLLDLRTGTINCEKQLDLDAKKEKTLYREELRELFDEFDTSLRRFQSIDAFLQFHAMLEQKKQEMEQMRQDPTVDAVHLMTIHSAKGLEYDAVFAIGWFEGMLPHFKALTGEQGLLADDLLTPQQALEEERRLAYVCATRAKERLYISSVRRYHNQQRKFSRFLLEGARLTAPTP